MLINKRAVFDGVCKTWAAQVALSELCKRCGFDFSKLERTERKS